MKLLNYSLAFGQIKYEQLKDLLNKSNISLEKEKQLLALKDLNLKGVTVIPGYYSAEKCNKIIGQIDKMIQDDSINKWYDDEKSDSRVFASHLYSDEIKQFHDDFFLREIGEAYTKSKIINSHTLGAKLVPKKSNLGSGGGWHRDSVYRIQYKSIVYLTDVTPENGPFEYVLGSHKKSSILKSIIRNNFNSHQNRMSEEQVNDFKSKNPDMVSKVFTAKKGSVILVDTSGIHRGMPIKKGERYALTNYFFPKHHYTSRAKKKFEKLF